MARRKAKRSEWHLTKQGAWTCSLGERGLRVRLFQKRKEGPYYRAVWLKEGKSDQRPLGTRDREIALRLGRALLAEMLKAGAAAATSTLSLGQLWQRYSSECEEFLDNKPRTRADANSRAKILIAFFGFDFPVADFTLDDQRRYEAARMAGGIAVEGRKTPKTRARSAESDVTLLHTMLRWATTKRKAGGQFLLERHPLQNVKRVREKNKKQPRATWERYDATMNAMQRLLDEASERHDQTGRVRWTRMRFALFLAEQTGRRLGSIRKLRWEDFYYESGAVFWRAEADKKGYEWEIPMPPTFMQTVRTFQRELGAVTGPVFCADNAENIMDRHLFDKWLTVAEVAAGLPKLNGSLWHAYRRKWAIERKHLPIKDVAAAGGWKDINTLLEIYQQSDAASVLAVMSETKKLFERGVA